MSIKLTVVLTDQGANPPAAHTGTITVTKELIGISKHWDTLSALFNVAGGAVYDSHAAKLVCMAGSEIAIELKGASWDLQVGKFGHADCHPCYGSIQKIWAVTTRE